MPRFCANLSLLFTEFPLEQRFAQAAVCGFEAVEIQFPYALSSHELQELLQQHRLSLELFNLPAGNWHAGERGIACHPDRIEEFRAGVERALEYARATGCRKINCLAGIALGDRSVAMKTLVANLAYAAERLADQGLMLLIEAINTRDIPGFLLHNSQQAFELMAQVGADNLCFQYDVYHMQVMEGDLIHTLACHMEKIGHLQVADAPGRHEPGTGEINFPNLFIALDELGYTGRVGLEYLPLSDTKAGLSWMTGLTPITVLKTD